MTEWHRRERLKIAAMMMAAYIERLKLYEAPHGFGIHGLATDLSDIEACAGLAVQAADLLLAELDKKETTDAKV